MDDVCSGLGPLEGFGISDVEISGSITRDLLSSLFMCILSAGYMTTLMSQII
jgi:hypothetical protein